MAAWDAPSREVCTIRRPRTNTPLQALVTLNDPTHIEAAQGLGRRLLSRDETDRKRLAFGYTLVRNRPASGEVVAALEKLLDHARQYYREHADEAEAFATDPLGDLPKGMNVAEAAAWTVVGNTLLNLDGVMSK